MGIGKATVIHSIVDVWSWICMSTFYHVCMFTICYVHYISHLFSNLYGRFSARLLESKSQRRSCSKKKLVMIAKQIEISLYHQAESLDAYLDKVTLQQRVREKAIDSLRESTMRTLANNNVNCTGNCSVLRDENECSNRSTPTTLHRIEYLTIDHR